jgi:hypothetical protein
MATLQWNIRKYIGKRILNFYWSPNNTLKYQSKRKRSLREHLQTMARLCFVTYVTGLNRLNIR